MRQVKVLKLISRKKTSVLVFINKDCPCVKAHQSYFKGLEQKFGVKIWFIHSNKRYSRENVLNHYSGKLDPEQIIVDKDLNIANYFEAMKTPHTVVLSSNGEVVYQGGVTNSRNPKNASKFYLNDVLRDLQSNVEVSWKRGKAIGCFIQR